MSSRSQLHLLLLMFCAFEVFSDSTSIYSTFISNTSVPQSEISLDSIVADRYFYSGAAYYDLEAGGSAVSVHAFMEEIPFAPYVIATFTRTGDSHNYGNGVYRKIDSLCTGDIGIVRKRGHCSLRWSYSTSNLANHCRLKIGLGNFLYAKTKDSIEGRATWTYRYNQTGTISSIQIDPVSSTSPQSRIIVPKYTSGGQPMIDDTSRPFAVNGYDEKERLTFAKEADEIGLILHFVYGFAYDADNRAIEQRSLKFGATPDNTGQSFNTVFVTYDRYDRLLSKTKNLSYDFRDPLFWPTDVHFDTKEITGYFYTDGIVAPCSSTTVYYDANRNYIPLARSTVRNFYSATGRLDSTLSMSQGLDSPGTVYGPRNYSESKVVPIYDSRDWAYRSTTWHKYYSPDSPFVKFDGGNCSRREYDSIGNVIKQFDLCDSNEQLLWSRQYNEFNAPILQKTPDAANPGRSTQTWFYWSLIDLDTAKEHFHD